MTRALNQLWHSVWDPFWHLLDPVTFFIPILEKIVIMYWLVAGVYSAAIYILVGIRPRLWFGTFYDSPVTPGAPWEWGAWLLWTIIAAGFLIGGFFTSKGGGIQKRAVGTALFYTGFISLMGLLFARW